jgi:hypothetical protein
MKILINRKPVDGPWGGGNLFLTNMCKYFTEKGHHVTHQIEDNIDVIFIINPRYDSLGISINEAIRYKKKHPNTLIVQRINDCDSRKNTQGVDEMLIQCSQYIDVTIFVSFWMKKYFINRGWKCNNNFVVINGVETETIKVDKIKNGKINIVTHHWSNNYLKGFDVYDAIDKFVATNSSFTFTYIGRDRGTFSHTTLIQPLHGEELYKNLKKYDVYISASRFDPGPNHILESISCNLPTYVHKDGGGCVEFAGIGNSFNDLSDLITILESKNYVNNKIKLYNWNECIELLNNIIEESKNGA